MKQVVAVNFLSATVYRISEINSQKITKPVAVNFRRAIAIGFDSYLLGNPMVIQQKLTSQILASKTRTSQEQQQTLALTSTQYRSVINPSRSITLDDEIYLRDYALAAFVISWNKCTYG